MTRQKLWWFSLVLALSGASTVLAEDHDPTIVYEPPGVRAEVPALPEEEPPQPPTPGADLRPKGEDEAMAPHPIGRDDRIRFQLGKGVVFSSNDDKFELRLRVRVQFLLTVKEGDFGSKEADEPLEPQNRFEIRRARLIFQGFFLGKHNQYKFEIDPVRPDNVVLDYYLDFGKFRNWSGILGVRIGQYKLSSNRQRVISSADLQMVDRSRVNAEFSLDRDLGIDIRSSDDDFLRKYKMRWVLGLSTGDGINNPRFTELGRFVYLARIEYLPFGKFKDYSEVDFERSGPRLSIGAGYSFFDDANRDRGMIGAQFADGGTADYHFTYADVMFKARGFSTLSEFAFRTGKRMVGDITVDEEGNPIEPTAPRNGLGWMLQAGYLIPRVRFEFAGRFALIQARRPPTSLEDSYAGTVSASYYFFRHPLKIQADFTQSRRVVMDESGRTNDVDSWTFRLQLSASM